MSLITRCPACTTLFKVVPDQLRISAGWVRCGHCGEVFDAAAALLSHEQSQGLSSPPPPAEPGRAWADEPGPVAETPELVVPSPAASEAPLWGAGQDDRLAPAPGAPVETCAPAPAEAESTQPATEAPLEATGEDANAAPDDRPPPSPGEPPSFVRQARRAAFWRSTPVRLFLLVLALGLGALLAAQWAISQRDWLAAREPRTAVWLQKLCQPVGCQLAPYRELEAIVIDSSAFNRMGPAVFRLGLALRNTGDLPLAMPAVELTLTSAQDAVVLRRVIQPAEMAAPEVIPARGEWAGAGTISVASPTDAAAIAGYRLLVFYP